jgi:hypothetical protein
VQSCTTNCAMLCNIRACLVQKAQALGAMLTLWAAHQPGGAGNMAGCSGPTFAQCTTLYNALYKAAHTTTTGRQGQSQPITASISIGTRPQQRLSELGLPLLD